MIRLSLKRYSFILIIQLILLFSDLLLNCVGVFFKGRKAVTFLYFLQDSFLLLSIASLIYMCYSTYVYQVGMTKVINKNFRVPVAIIFIYILLSITHHFSSVYFGFGENNKWRIILMVLSGIQKLSKKMKKNFLLL